MTRIKITSPGEAVAIEGIALSTHYKVSHITVTAAGEVSQRSARNPPLPWFRAKLDIAACSDRINVYTLPRRVDLAGVTITAQRGAWTLHKFNRETGKLIEAETHDADGPGVSVLRRAASLAKTRDGKRGPAVVLVAPLQESFFAAPVAK